MLGDVPGDRREQGISKLDIHEDSTNRIQIAELMRYQISMPGDEKINLTEYADRMREGQNDIYDIISESLAAVSSFLFLESLREKSREGLHMVDPIDESAVQQLKEFDGKKPKSITKEGLDVDDEDRRRSWRNSMQSLSPSASS